MISAKWRRLIAPGLAALALFCALIALGVWQLHRLTWKEGIIAELQRAEAAPPVKLPATPSPFQKIIITGAWVPGKAALYGDEVRDTPTGPVAGGELIMPLRRAGGEIVLVDLGWVQGQSPAPVAALPDPVGYMHAAITPGWFSAPDDPAHQLYYTLDPQRIGAGLGLKVAPYILIRMGPLPAPGSAAPQPVQALPEPPNNHYQYALTWFGLAGVLLIEFIIFARKRLLAA